MSFTNFHVADYFPLKLQVKFIKFLIYKAEYNTIKTN